jgi:hypothetical protein
MTHSLLVMLIVRACEMKGGEPAVIMLTGAEAFVDDR